MYIKALVLKAVIRIEGRTNDVKFLLNSLYFITKDRKHYRSNSNNNNNNSNSCSLQIYFVLHKNILEIIIEIL